MGYDPVWMLMSYGAALMLLIAGLASAMAAGSRVPLYICASAAVFLGIMSILVALDVVEAVPFGVNNPYDDYVSAGVGDMLRRQGIFCIMSGMLLFVIVFLVRLGKSLIWRSGRRQVA